MNLKTVIEYVISIDGLGTDVDLKVPGSRGVEDALRTWNAVTSTNRDGGYANLIAVWSYTTEVDGGGHVDQQQGMILAHYNWERAA